MLAFFTPAVRRRTLAALLLAASLSFGRCPAVRAAEPLVAMAHAVPPAVLVHRAHLLGRQPADTPVSAGLTLPLRNQDALHTLLRRLYDPKDPLHGKFLSATEFNRQFGPTQADYNAVAGFARAHGLAVEAHAGRTLVSISGASGDVERAFNVRLNQYRTPEGRVAYANDAAPRLPASVAARLSGVIGLDNLVLVKPHLRHQVPADLLEAVRPFGIRSSDAVGVGTDVPSGGLTPTDIKNVYNLANVQYQGEGQSVDIIAPGGGYDLSDIGAYVSKYGLPTDAGAFVNRAVNGYDGSVGPNFEETVLDLDMIVAMAPRVNHVFVYISPTSYPVDSLAVLTAAADEDQAQVVSYSYGLTENVTEFADRFSIYQSLFNSQEQVYERMAAQGQSLFVSSGDSGAYDDNVDLSVSGDATPPTCTAVGGTKLSVSNSTSVLSYLSESAWGNTAETDAGLHPKGSGGGGGISNFWSIPSYQQGAITAASEGSTAMRNIPDVSLNADLATGYAIYINADTPAFTDSFTNHFMIVGGTSAAAPLWAGFAALVNEGRALGGATPTTGATPGTPAHPLGFANPLIYAIGLGQYGSYSSDFHDIADNSTNLFYHAVTGYDDATGWGSFNGANLLADMVAAGGNGTTGGGGGTTTGPTAVLSGTVTFNGSTPANVSATIKAVSADGSATLTTTSDPVTGAYSLTLPLGPTFTVSATATGYLGQSVPNITLTASGLTQNFALTASSGSTGAHTFAAGLQMISAPFDFSGTGADFAGLFGLSTPLQSTDPRLIIWQPVPLPGAYAFYPTAPADTLRPGIGYWLRVPANGASLQLQGASVAAPYTIILQAGWNQIGDPFGTSEPLSDVFISADAAGTNSVALPQATNLVSSTLYTYPPTTVANAPYVSESSALQPYLGYWIFARQAVYLTYTDGGRPPGGP